MSIETPGVAEDFAAVFCSVARNTLRTALGRPCQWSIGPSQAFSAPPGGGVMVEYVLTEAVQGHARLFLGYAEAGLLADLMMMGDGSGAWTADQMDALQELGSQLAGALGTNQSERWSSHVTCRATAKDATQPAPGSMVLSVDIQGFDTRQAWFDVDAELQASLEANEKKLLQHTDSPWSMDFDAGLGEALAQAAAMAADARGGGNAESVLDFSSGLSVATASDLSGTQEPTGERRRIDSSDPAIKRLLDVPIEITIELGQTELSIRRILEIGPGSIIELDRMAGEPVDMVVNGKVIAKGEVVVIDENFGLRVTQLVSPEERLRPLR